MLAAVVERLNVGVPALGGRIEEAAELTDMLQKRGLPQRTTTFVVPLGIQARPLAHATGAVIQDFAETIGVLLVARVHDQTGANALAKIRPLIMDVVSTLVGWAPDASFGVFELRRGTLVGIRDGALIYMTEFSITDQLRIQA
ncbi:hypothetical protein [Phaeobacter inhibens]|uniref:phage tail terminator protein n=1 Tax=Phaeobacter inhibens TaxID=221822 RepID=UPI00076BB297|nr:hypothetical protein [Phaeobacter inhibens]KXF92090.1 hypothetical protein AT574_03805 [Phaeobacter inhibens]WHP69925.1 hypothetical protein QMZ01_07055 [Phaeobacter inhibens]